MSSWAALTDVRARVAYGTISSTSKPSQDEVQAWLNEAEAKVRGVLAAQGLGTTYAAGSDGALILGAAVTDYAEGRVQNVWSSNDGAPGRAGDPLLTTFAAFLEQLRNRSIQLGGELAGGDVAESVVTARSYATDNTDGLSIEAGDFEPVMTTRWKD